MLRPRLSLYGAASRDSGFSLIEAMITLTVLAVILVLGAPSLVAWTNNARVRTASQGLQDGLRLAQAEAVRRNRTVEFFLVDGQPALGSVSAANGRNWGVRAYPNPPAAPNELIRVGVAGSTNDEVTVTGPRSVCFGPAGQQITLAAINCAAAEQQFNVSSARADRPLRVVVSIGGRVRMCDPARALAANVPEGC